MVITSRTQNSMGKCFDEHVSHWRNGKKTQFGKTDNVLKTWDWNFWTSLDIQVWLKIILFR